MTWRSSEPGCARSRVRCRALHLIWSSATTDSAAEEIEIIHRRRRLIQSQTQCRFILETGVQKRKLGKVHNTCLPRDFERRGIMQVGQSVRSMCFCMQPIRLIGLCSCFVMFSLRSPSLCICQS